MKNISVKLKLTILLTLLTAAMSVLLLLFMLSISSTVIVKGTMTQLSETVQKNLKNLSFKDGKLELTDEFSFYHNGVSTLVYSKNETLIAGQVPVAYNAVEPFENGVIKTVATGDTDYLILDLWLALSWDDGLWVRGLIPAPQQQNVTASIIQIALISLPVFIALAAVGSYFIAKRSFKPLDTINAAAEAINDAKDLKGRIAMSADKNEFTRLAGTIDNMFARLEQAFEAEKQFTADASHELRTPVAIIKGACEYAQKYDETPQERAETIEMINRQASLMSSLISQLLSMTRLDQGTQALNFEPLDLGSLAHTVCSQLSQEQRFVFNLQKNVIVNGDKLLLTRLIQNLADNALKYSADTSEIIISVEAKQKQCIFSVKDSGIGISLQQQEKIWQRFYQLDNSRSENTGAGLGLSMVQKIAAAHNGKMTVESEVNVGSTFTLYLPCADL